MAAAGVFLFLGGSKYCTDDLGRLSGFHEWVVGTVGSSGARDVELL